MLIQSNLVSMPPLGTEVKWHSNKSRIVTCFCCSIDETTNATNKAINGCNIRTVHVTYSLKLCSSGRKCKESSAGACSFDGSSHLVF